MDLVVVLTDPAKEQKDQTFTKRQLRMRQPSIASTRSRAALINSFPFTLFVDLVIARHVHSVFWCTQKTIKIFRKKKYLEQLSWYHRNTFKLIDSNNVDENSNNRSYQEIESFIYVRRNLIIGLLFTSLFLDNSIQDIWEKNML